MEDTGNTTQTDNSCPETSNHERNNDTNRSNDSLTTDQLPQPNSGSNSTERSNVLADTLNQPIQATPATVEGITSPGPTAGSTGGGFVPQPGTSNPGMTGLADAVSKETSEVEYQGNIMEQISAPTVLPDLNLVMAEGLSTDGIGEKPADSADGCTEKGIPPAGSILSAPSSPPLSSLRKNISSSETPTASGGGIAVGSVSTTAASINKPSVEGVSKSPATNTSTSVSNVLGSASLVPSTSAPQRTTTPVSSLPFKPSSQSVKVSSSRPAVPQFPPPCSVTPLSNPSPGPSSSATSISLTPQSASSSTSTSTSTKGLNLPLLQFLNLNFPSLKIKDLQDVLSINTLLTQVLKQQLNTSSSPSTTQQQSGEGSKQVQSKPITSLSSSSTTVTMLPSTSGGSSRISTTPFKLSKQGVSPVKSGVSPVKSGASGSSLVIPSRPVSVPSGAGISKSFLAPASSQVKSPALTLGTKSSDSKQVSATSGLGINVDLLSKQSSSLLSSLESPPSSSGPATSTNSTSRKAVLVQILNKTQPTPPTTVTTTPPSKSPILIPRMKSLSKSPLILNRHGRSPTGTSTSTALARSLIPSKSSTPPASNGKASTPVSSLCVSLSLPALKGTPNDQSKRRTAPRKSAHLTTLDMSHQSPQQLSRTVVQPAESEAMEVDVGQPVQKMKLPQHLRDHSYSLYNPEEAERQRLVNVKNFSFLSSIPPARLSYAPQVPDSPSTLHKLLKVLPKKNTRQANSPPRLGRNIGGRKSRAGKKGGGGGGGGGGRNMSKGRGKSNMKKVGSSPAPEMASEASSSDQSDTDEPSGKNRRRSQRNAGQRKRYVDDLHISDEELLEDVMSSRPPRKKDYKGYGNQEEDDLDGWGAGGSAESQSKEKFAAKHKSRTISINPTEGFQYSDVYFEPPAEEANLVERILAQRVRESQKEEEKATYGETVEEYFVKYKNYSYLHAEWATFGKLLQGDRRFDGKVKRFKAKQASLGIFSNVDNEPFNPEYTEVDRALDVATQTEPNGEVVTHYLVKWKSLPYEDATWELEEDIDAESIATFNRRQMLPSAKELSFAPRPPPASFKPIKEAREYKDNNYLRSYQREGLNWLVFNWYARQNCILADEMGLGKTVQSIAFLIEVFKAGIRGPFLVIVPLSTIGNWQREFATWSDFNVIIYHGSAYSRRLIHEYDLYYRDSQGKIISESFKFNVIVTTYEVMLSDDSELQNIDWRVVVIDEAHRLKNRNCKLLEGLKRLSMEHRVLLTGTPLQNSVEELFSLLNFLEPHTFPSHVSFLQQFGDLKTEEQVEELKTILKPMMLRRLKEDVEKSIAPKEETIIEVELTAIQKQYYRAILERNFMFLSKGSSAATTAIPSLLNVMMELRKCCNHPFLIKGAEQKIVSDWQVERPTEPVINSLIQASGKLVLIDKLLPKLKESGHKVLIFSQMVRCLDIMEDYLRMKGYLYERIDGQVRGTLRQEAIDRFSKPDTDRFVFLLCTRAGGLGINLTAADTVIIYDSDWNPQNDIQAQARCHRIGQNKPVKVYRLITRNSYEREMFDRASLKLGLDKAVLHSVTTSQQQPTGPPQLSKREIEDLLKKGAYGALMEGNDDDANRFCEEDIDQILEQRAHVVQLESEGKGSTFSKASFVADESSDINVDDPDFWQKWAERAKLNLDELANKDNLVLDTPRQRRQVRRYGNDHLEGEIVDMIDPREDVVPSRGRHGWTKIELFKTEKWMLIYGWGQWKDILEACDFRKRQLGVGDVENISRTILIYCLSHFKGDEKIPLYIHRLVDPSEVTEEGDEAEGSQFTEDDYLALLSKNPETLFQDEGYMKHLRRHAHKIIFRIRQLHIIRWQMLVGFKKQIMKGTSVKHLGLHLPRPEETPPTSWWTGECDHSLVVGILKHGYEQFHLFRSDPALCFKALVGEESTTGLRKRKNHSTPLTKEKKEDEEEEEDEFVDFSGEDSDGESAPSTPGALCIRLPNRKAKNLASNSSPSPKTGLYVWPTLADVNTRARRLVSAWLKQQKKEEQKQVHLMRERVKREREAEVSRKKEQKKAELAQKWSKREEQDYARVITFFGVVFDSKSNKYNWTKFRQLANLSKKSDERLTLYLHDFQQMCRRVLRKKPIRRGLSGIRVEPITEERAIRCLQRIELLSAVRSEILPHPDFDVLIELCEQSFEVPNWWLPGSHDRDLLRGVAKHGLFRSDQLIYGDTDFCFKQTVPQTALFDPATNQVAFQEDDDDDDESGDSDEEEEEGPKLRSTLPPWSNPVPLGWPKEKAIAIRITRIAYAFRNRVWPKPMEGLDLFNPTISDESSDESSMSEVESEVGGRSDSDFEVATTRSTRRKTAVGATPTQPRGRGGGGGGGVGGRLGGRGGGEGARGNRRDFEIEKQQGLKMTFKKSSHTQSHSTKSKELTKRDQSKKASDTPKDTPPLKLEIRIPLVKLSFVSKSGLKRIPKKKPSERSTGGSSDQPEAKKQKTQHSNTQLSGVDPSKVNFTDLTGHERVGVVNRNTNEKLPLKQSPMLKNLKFWLEGHPHFNVEPKWGSLVIEWGALKPEMYHRVLLTDPLEQSSPSSMS